MRLEVFALVVSLAEKHGEVADGVEGRHELVARDAGLLRS